MGLFNKKENIEDKLLQTFIEGVKIANENRETIGKEIFDRQEPNLKNFGLCESNPVFTTSLNGTEDYFSRLCTKSGEKFTWSSYRENRATVHGYENIGEDVYTLYLNGEKYTDIYVVPYVGESKFPPANLYFCDDDTDWDLEREAFEKGLTGAQLIEIRKLEKKEHEYKNSKYVEDNSQEFSQSIAMTKNNFNMVCPKCNTNIPNDSIFCPNCGCNIEEEKKQTITEPKPEIKVVEKVVEKVVVKKNKTNKVLVIFLVLSIIVSSVLGYFTFTYYQKSNDYSKEVKELTDSNKILMNRYDETSVAREVLQALESSENWGYATENFHADTGVIVLSKYSDAKEITLYSTYEGATFILDNPNTDIVNTCWEEYTKDVEGESIWDKIIKCLNHEYVAPAGFSSTKIIVKPQKAGTSILTITNSRFDNEVKILVIVT